MSPEAARSGGLSFLRTSSERDDIHNLPPTCITVTSDIRCSAKTLVSRERPPSGRPGKIG